MNEKLNVEHSGQRYDMYGKWERAKNRAYDYITKGLLQHILSSNIVKTKNKLTRFMLDFYESSIKFVLNYIDELKNFKNVHWKNR